MVKVLNICPTKIRIRGKFNVLSRRVLWLENAFLQTPGFDGIPLDDVQFSADTLLLLVLQLLYKHTS